MNQQIDSSSLNLLQPSEKLKNAVELLLNGTTRLDGLKEIASTNWTPIEIEQIFYTQGVWTVITQEILAEYPNFIYPNYIVPKRVLWIISFFRHFIRIPQFIKTRVYVLIFPILININLDHTDNIYFAHRSIQLITHLMKDGNWEDVSHRDLSKALFKMFSTICSNQLPELPSLWFPLLCSTLNALTLWIGKEKSMLIHNPTLVKSLHNSLVLLLERAINEPDQPLLFRHTYSFWWLLASIPEIYDQVAIFPDFISDEVLESSSADNFPIENIRSFKLGILNIKQSQNK
eukprot:TRINITY_DN2748_c0_g3_i1.p1 TRINITY_DN2748_c0_g3~~TRINITY_DN2748_c0_g3_i1.p1  ORF type:complete len:289 (+),score=67.74 TRINITY_DN2748_c0_g3_i1:42-908(+)